MRGIVFDADHTLIDFNADAVNAYERLCARCGARADGTGFLAAAYRKWEEHGLHRVDTERVLRGFHEIYREYVADLFSLASQEEPALSGREGEYIGLLSEEGKPLGASLETVARLSERYPIFVATNGLSAMQRGRLRAFAPYARELFISEELGCIKPDAAFFSAMIARTGIPAGELLMVGDSYASDIVGGRAADMRTCLLGAAGGESGADMTISRIEELLERL